MSILDNALRKTRQQQLEQKFWAYHDANPIVWEWVQHIALREIRQGRKRYGMQAVIEEIRWNTKLQIQGDDPVKIPSLVNAYYARYFEEMYPEHTGFFHIRPFPSARKPAQEDEAPIPDADQDARRAEQTAETEAAVRARMRVRLGKKRG